MHKLFQPNNQTDQLNLFENDQGLRFQCADLGRHTFLFRKEGNSCGIYGYKGGCRKT